MRTIYTNCIKSLAALTVAAMSVLLAGCGASGVASTTTTTTTTGPVAAMLTLSASPATVPSDNTATTTVTVTALSSTNAAVPGVVVTLGTDTGIVSAQTVTTGTDGTATFTFRSGVTSLANRTATITASAGATAQIQVQILGSTLSVFSTTGSSVPNNGSSPVTITFIAKNAQGTGLANTPFTASWVTTTGGQLTLNPTSGTTDAAGKFDVIVSGAGAPATGTATVTATAAGSSASATINVTTAAGTFGISQTSNSTGPVVTVNPTAVAMTISDALTVTVSAPASANVTFTTSQGTWGNGSTSQTVAVANGVASAVLTQTQAGQANVQVDDRVGAAPPTNTDSLIVGITAVTPYRISLTASPTVVAKSSATSSGTSTLIATVLDASNQPVGNAAVAFSMSNTTGGGESVSPVVAYTAAIAGTNGLGLGQASATFTSGSLSSSQTGVQVRATVQSPTCSSPPNPSCPVATNTSPSGNDAAIVIGGTAGSIAFTIGTKITPVGTTAYKLPMSVLVSDSYGNPVPNTTVNLSVWPVAWSTRTGTPCTVDADDGVSKGTFYGEDINENLMLDTAPVVEDGYRKYYAGGVVVTGGTMDGRLTPVNSDAGTVPSSVTTGADGLANFDLTYLTGSAIWTVDRIRATAVVQGTEAVSEKAIRLPAADTDMKPCVLDSPYFF